MCQNEIIYRELAGRAIAARKISYSPYSNFQVGAALLAADGQIYTGCNIENAAFTPTNCAERTAFFKAVSEGQKTFTAIAIAGGRADAAMPLDTCTPCGVCLQVMMEFCRPEDFQILLVRSDEDYRICKLKDLLPEGFGPLNLNNENE